MSSEPQPGQVLALQGGRDKPPWAPRWLPTASTLEYIANLATVLLIALGLLFFLGIEPLRPFAKRHVADV